MNGISVSKQRVLFLISITVAYTLVVASLDFLQGELWRDEIHYWATSLTFSDRLIPTLDQLRDYDALNTPLPFMLFGALEYLFHGGPFLGRVFNLLVSLAIVFIVAWPTRVKQSRALLCLVGLLIYPYFLPLSGYIYTDTIASFFGLIGCLYYIRNRQITSTIAFILAIASRQYMIAFPMAVAVYEFIQTLLKRKQDGRVDGRSLLRLFLPIIAVFSIVGWIILFQGLAPNTAISGRAPAIQQAIWSIQPGAAINYLAAISVYILIPEFFLFRQWTQWSELTTQKRRITVVAIALLLYILIDPPYFTASGQVIKIARLLPNSFLMDLFYYALALWSCLRFSRLNLLAFWVISYGVIMMKAYPGADKYIFPIVVVFWFMKSLSILDLSDTKEAVDSSALAHSL